MIPEEYRPMIEKILKLTKKRDIEWQTTSDSQKFELDAGDKTIILREYAAFPTNEPTVSLEIRNNYGELIDGIYTTSDEGDFYKMENLVSMARRNALKIEQTISGIMSFLEEKDTSKDKAGTTEDEFPF